MRVSWMSAIEQSGVKIIPKGKSSLDIVLHIKEGKRSFFGEVNIAGNSVLTTEELLRLDKRENKELKTGDPYSPTLLSEERNRLRKKYGELGYLDAQYGFDSKAKSSEPDKLT